MRNWHLLSILIVATLMLVGCGDSDSSSDYETPKVPAAPEAPTSQPATQPSAANISNTKCPVMGGDVDLSVTTVTYQGKTYGFCCDGCNDKFKTNPAKYLSELKLPSVSG